MQFPGAPIQNLDAFSLVLDRLIHNVERIEFARRFNPKNSEARRGGTATC
jgi:hypothetical protein